MDAVKFLKEKKRICNTHSSCSDCPLYDTFGSCNSPAVEDVDNLISAVEKWSKEHPVKTNLEYFKECFPKLNKSEKELVFDYCAEYLGLNHLNYDCDVCTGDCIECWNLPYEEAK